MVSDAVGVEEEAGFVQDLLDSLKYFLNAMWPLISTHNKASDSGQTA